MTEVVLWTVGTGLLWGVAPPRQTGAVLVLATLVRAAVEMSRFTRRFVAVTVRGRSMEPAFREGDRVLVRRDSGPRAGDVVVLRHPPAGSDAATTPSWIIKRVAATPGQPVPLATVRPGTRVPAGRLVLLGDNRGASTDSRHVGYYRSDDLLGTVVRRLSTANRAGERVAPEITRD
ncbi:S26 family signal peptidase [Micromonospora sp. NBC_00330]|uniref:S26 family signal peptidase n=1 Tax=Micromonospora sp. NBC_00330 TaxID=2903585 RepID=UPI002E27B320|nr:S26 family signal peptidase [Micromonospora sp. NBC_00330]